MTLVLGSRNLAEELNGINSLPLPSPSKVEPVHSSLAVCSYSWCTRVSVLPCTLGAVSSSKLAPVSLVGGAYPLVPELSTLSVLVYPYTLAASSYFEKPSRLPRLQGLATRYLTACS